MIQKAKPRAEQTLTLGAPEKTLNSVYRIRAVARMTGLAPGLIRAWERRYGLIRPQRSTSGQYRLYTDREVAILKGAKTLVARGLAIGEVARLAQDELLAAAGPAEPASNGPAAPAVADAAVGQAIVDAIEAIQRFDREGLELVVGRFAAPLAPVDLCRQVLLPMLREIGNAWYRGELSVAMEHFSSALLRARILRTLELLPRAARGPRVVCGCPAGELHEGALLTFAVHAAGAGWEVIYLGASVPDEDLLDTVRRVDAPGAGPVGDHGRQRQAGATAGADDTGSCPFIAPGDRGRNRRGRTAGPVRIGWDGGGRRRECPSGLPWRTRWTSRPLKRRAPLGHPITRRNDAHQTNGQRRGPGPVDVDGDTLRGGAGRTAGPAAAPTRWRRAGRQRGQRAPRGRPGSPASGPGGSERAAAALRLRRSRRRAPGCRPTRDDPEGLLWLAANLGGRGARARQAARPARVARDGAAAADARGQRARLRPRGRRPHAGPRSTTRRPPSSRSAR